MIWLIFHWEKPAKFLFKKHFKWQQTAWEGFKCNGKIRDSWGKDFQEICTEKKFRLFKMLRCLPKWPYTWLFLPRSSGSIDFELTGVGKCRIIQATEQRQWEWGFSRQPPALCWNSQVGRPWQPSFCALSLLACFLICKLGIMVMRTP